MSADNAIAILITRDRLWKVEEGSWVNMGKETDIWRVAHIQNPESFEEYREEELHNLGYWMDHTFGNAPAFKTSEEALAEADKQYLDKSYVEHGIITYDARPMNFPGH